jgi:hypothetical protein
MRTDQPDGELTIKPEWLGWSADGRHRADVDVASIDRSFTVARIVGQLPKPDAISEAIERTNAGRSVTASELQHLERNAARRIEAMREAMK